MAVVSNLTDKDKENQEQTGGNPQVVNGGVSAQTNVVSAPAPATTQKQGTSSGRFTNLNAYLNANKNYNQEGGGLAGKVASNLNNQGNQINQSSTQAVANLQNQANAQVAQVQQVNPLLSQVTQDPTKLSENDQKQIISARDATYTGPKGLQDLTGQQNQAVLQNQANNFAGRTQDAQTEGGRFNLLKNMFNRQGYTTGQQKFDNLLVQGNKEQIKQIQDTRKLASNVNNTLNNNIQAANNAVQQAANSIDSTKDQVREAIKTGITNTDADLLKRAQEAQLQRDRQLAKVRDDLNAGVSHYGNELTGLHSGDKLFNVNLGDYLREDTIKANQYNIGNEQDYAKVNALAKLAGDSISPEISKLIAQYQGAETNKFNSNKGYTYDQAALQDAIAKSQDEFNTQLNALYEASKDQSSKIGGIGAGSLDDWYNFNKTMMTGAPDSPFAQLLQKYNPDRTYDSDINRLIQANMPSIR